jgi:hypothetical protein
MKLTKKEKSDVFNADVVVNWMLLLLKHYGRGKADVTQSIKVGSVVDHWNQHGQVSAGCLN